MLVLSRKIRERIRIQVPGWPDILVSFEDGDRSKIKVGIDAPKEVRVLRDEVYQAQKEEGVPT